MSATGAAPRGAGPAVDPGDGHQGWHPVTRSRSHELVVDQIEEQILAGWLRVGDRLPGERELASRLQVSRSAVREAIRTLEAQGVVRAAAGSGKEAGTIVSAMSSQALTRLLRLHVALANFPVPDVVEARITLERSSAALAAANAGPENLTAMRAALDGMDRTGISREAFNELDTAFHVAIAEATQNRLVCDMTSAIRDSMKRPILSAMEALQTDWVALVIQLREDHHGIYTAIETGNAGLAADRVERHIRWAYETLPFPDAIRPRRPVPPSGP